MESDQNDYPCTADELGECSCDDCRQADYETHCEMMALATGRVS